PRSQDPTVLRKGEHLHPRIAAAPQPLFARSRVQHPDRPVWERYGNAATVRSEGDYLRKAKRGPFINRLRRGDRETFLAGRQLPQTTGVGSEIHAIALSQILPRDGEKRTAVRRKSRVGNEP